MRAGSLQQKLLAAVVLAAGLLCLAPGVHAADAWPAGSFAVLCYHDVQDDLRQRPDFYAIETRQLAQQFAWLREQGYHVVALDDVLAARRGERALPDRAVLLTFDDGLQSLYTRVYPLLVAFHYPAIAGLVGGWLEEPSADQPAARYPAEHLSRNDFLSAAQIREMQHSGLIEFGSHTYQLHEGIPANPQGNLEPAAVTRRFDAASAGYETGAAYATRVRDDLARSSSDVAQLTGAAPRLVVWPYGEHNQIADKIAAQLGMPYGMTLEPGMNTPDVPLNRMRRLLVTHEVTTIELARALQRPPPAETLRVVQVDLDYVYDRDPVQQEANLSKLLDRIQALGVNTVFLQAYADPEGTGTATALYFPNRRMPMRSDLYNRAAWQLRTRTGVAVYAWMPMLAFALPETDPAHDHWVQATNGKQPGSVQRLSPFDPLVRQAVHDIYEDLSAAVIPQGLLFSDDATMSDFEDASPPALATYRDWGLPSDVAAIRADSKLAQDWSSRKIRYLTEFSAELAGLLRADHQNVRTARNLFAEVAGDPKSQQWFGQSLPDALANYDYVALMAMPYLEGHDLRPGRWLEQLAARIAAQPGGFAKTVFELQSLDWAHQNQPIDGRTLAGQIELLRRAGALHFGYYPEDFHHGLPPVEALRPVLSVRTFP